MQKGGTVAEFAKWEHCVHTQRCKLTPIARGSTECQRVQQVLRLFGYGGLLSFEHMLKYTVACFPKHGRLCHPAKMRDWASRKALFRPPIIQNHHINICFSSTLPHGAHTSACHFPAVPSQTHISKQGEKLTLDLCSLQGMFSNAFQQCQGTMGHGKRPA